MKYINKLAKVLLATIALSELLTDKSNAAIVVTMGESGDNILIQWSGSVDTNGLSGLFVPPASTPGQTRAQFNLWFVRGNETNRDVYSGGTNLTFNFTNPATSFWNTFGTGSGGSVGIQANSSTSGFITLPENYTSNTLISGSLTLFNTDFATLGVIDGVTSTASWDAGVTGIQEIVFETDRLAFPAQSTPESSTILSLLTIGGIALGASTKKKQG